MLIRFEWPLRIILTNKTTKRPSLGVVSLVYVIKTLIIKTLAFCVKHISCVIFPRGVGRTSWLDAAPLTPVAPSPFVATRGPDTNRPQVVRRPRTLVVLLIQSILAALHLERRLHRRCDNNRYDIMINITMARVSMTTTGFPFWGNNTTTKRWKSMKESGGRSVGHEQTSDKRYFRNNRRVISEYFTHGKMSRRAETADRLNTSLSDLIIALDCVHANHAVLLVNLVLKK